MKASRLVDIVNGGRSARVAWRSLRTQVDADLERRLRHRGKWPAVQELLDVAIDRGPSEEVDAYLLSARDLLKKLAKDTESPIANAECRGMAAALSIRLGDPKAARKPIRKAIDILREAVTMDSPAVGVVARYFDDYEDRQYRRRYLGNELMDLNGRFVVPSIAVVKPPPRRQSGARKPAARRTGDRKGRAVVPSWDEILFGATMARHDR